MISNKRDLFLILRCHMNLIVSQDYIYKYKELMARYHVH